MDNNTMFTASLDHQLYFHKSKVSCVLTSDLLGILNLMAKSEVGISNLKF